VNAMKMARTLDAGAICRRDVITIQDSQPITAAARLMRDQHVGFLVVTEPPTSAGARKVVGVLTDRDIVVAVVAREADLRALTVGDVMTRSPLLIGESHSLDALLCLMRDAGVRRVPIVGQEGELLGVLSLDDVLERMAEQLTNIVGSIRGEQHTERLLRP
jgi:CBS domain-containing protein